MPSGCHELVEDDLTLVTAALDVATSDVDEQLALGQNTHGPPHLVPSACAFVRTRRVSSFVRQFPHPSVFFREAARLYVYRPGPDQLRAAAPCRRPRNRTSQGHCR